MPLTGGIIGVGIMPGLFKYTVNEEEPEFLDVEAFEHGKS